VTELITTYLPLAKVLAAFAVMLLGLRLRQPLWLSVLAGGLALALLFGMAPLDWLQVSAASIIQRDTVFLVIILALILFLSEVLDKSGQTARLMQAASGFLLDPRLRLAFFPALVGLLPMPGGAVFSAPLVRDMADELSLARRDTALVNYWFRHLWELCWPLYPGIILASSLAGVPLARLVVYTLPCIGLCVVLGWVFIMRPAVAHLQGAGREEGAPRDLRAALMSGLPMLVAIIGGLGLEVGMTLYAPGWPFELGIMTALALAILCSLAQNRVGPRFVAGVLRKAELYQLVALVMSILMFKDVLGASGAVEQLSRVASGPWALFVLTLALPFLVGLISGISVAFVGSTFPIILGIIGAAGAGTAGTAAPADNPQLMPHLVLGLFAGFTGVMVSPLHVCFILSCQFFGVDLAEAWRRLLLPCALLLCFGVAWFFVLLRFV
jgi:integral membrane protein (TIGR00529 family)